MFDISFLEIAVIGVITLLVVGPEKLPGLVRDVSRVIRKLRRIVTQTRYELEREFSFEEERKRLAKDLAKDSEGLNDAMDELDDLMKIAPDRDQDVNPLESNSKIKITPDVDQDVGPVDTDEKMTIGKDKDEMAEEVDGKNQTVDP